MGNLARSAAAALTCLASLACQAQGVKQATATYPGEIARSFWSLDASRKSTVLSTKTITNARWFLVTELGLDAGTSIELVVDGTSANYPVNFGGSALVWGKSILARNYSGSTGHLGQWTIIDASALQKIEVAWSIFPQTNHEAALGVFDTSREFFVFLSPDVSVGDCAGARVKPIVDNKPIPDENGNDLYLYPNGSVIASGKAVRLSAEGSCRPGKSLNGSMKLL